MGQINNPEKALELNLFNINVKKTYGIEEILNTEFSIKKGDFITILGKSGSGKTTLLNIISSLDEASNEADFVMYKNDNILNYSDDKKCLLRNNEFGFIYQFHHLIDNLTVLENVLLPSLINSKYNKKDFTEKANGFLKDFDILEHKNKLPNQLSGGQKQRVAIARALINDPEVIFADEPTGSLDENNRDKVFKILKQLNKEGKTIVMVTHDPNLVYGKVITLSDGKIISFKEQ